MTNNLNPNVAFDWILMDGSIICGHNVTVPLVYVIFVFGRATITLGICPHSSCISFVSSLVMISLICSKSLVMVVLSKQCMQLSECRALHSRAVLVKISCIARLWHKVNTVLLSPHG